jgi:mRNA-degrading endonuclease toxin of MazEF toxin-antitoxin module
MKEKVIKEGEVWYVEFPLEEDNTQFLNRPAVVLDVETLEVLSVKVTKHEPRACDKFDTPIVFWKEAKLHYKSTARVAKTIHIPKNQFKHKIGDLYPEDFEAIQIAFMNFLNSQD